MDPLSVAFGVIGVAGVACSSSKALYELICGLHDAPQDICDLRADLGVLCQILQALQQALQRQDDEHEPAAGLCDAQTTHLVEVKAALEGCRVTCDEFLATLNRIMRHSKDRDGHTSLRDRILFHFKDKEVTSFRAQLASYKATLAISLQFLTLKTATQDLEATRALESKIEIATTRLAGQVQGLQIGLQTFLDANADAVARADEQDMPVANKQATRVLQAIEQQNAVLAHCYRACIAALRGATAVTGNTYKYVSASDEARMLVGNVGDVSGSAKHVYEDISAGGKANVIIGNMQGDYMRDFFRS